MIQKPISILEKKIFEIEEKRFMASANILMRFYNEGEKDNREVSVLRFFSQKIVSNMIRTDWIEEIRRAKIRAGMTL